MGGLLEGLSALFQRKVNLVMPSAVKNPYFLESIERSRTLWRGGHPDRREPLVWTQTSVSFRFPVPRCALRFAEQVSWFLDHLPGHVLMLRGGPFCERITDGFSTEARSGSSALSVFEAWPRRFPRRRLPSLDRLLGNSDLPVAWIGETGRRPGSIAECALARRWPRPGKELYWPRSHASKNLQDEGRTVLG